MQHPTSSPHHHHRRLHRPSASAPLPIPYSYSSVSHPPLPSSSSSTPIAIQRSENVNEQSSCASSSSDGEGGGGVDDRGTRTTLLSGLSESLQDLNLRGEYGRHGTDDGNSSSFEARSLPPPRAPFLSSRGHGISSMPPIELPSSVDDDSSERTTPYGSLRSSSFYLHQQRHGRRLTIQESVEGHRRGGGIGDCSSPDESILSTSVKRFYPQSLPTYIDSEREFVQRRWGDNNGHASRLKMEMEGGGSSGLDANVNNSEMRRGVNNGDGDGTWRDDRGHHPPARGRSGRETASLNNNNDNDDGDEHHHQTEFLSTSFTALGILESNRYNGSRLGVSYDERERGRLMNSNYRRFNTVPEMADEMGDNSNSRNNLSSFGYVERQPSVEGSDDEEDDDREYGAFDFDLDE